MTNPGETVNLPVCPWDRPGRRQEAKGEGTDRDREPTEEILPKPPAGTGHAKEAHLKLSDFDAHGLTEGCPGCRAVRMGIRAQDLPAPCRARREELLQGSAQATAGKTPPNASGSSSPKGGAPAVLSHGATRRTQPCPAALSEPDPVKHTASSRKRSDCASTSQTRASRSRARANAVEVSINGCRGVLNLRRDE